VSEEELLVADDRLVTLAYVLRLDSGEVFERSEDKEPLQFIQGQGHIIPGLENALYGMHIGEEKEIVVVPGDGYGEYDQEDLDVIPREVFPEDLELVEGMGLRLREGESGEPFTAYIAQLNDDDVVLDFNHPLAGTTLYFQVRILEISKADPKELV